MNEEKLSWQPQEPPFTHPDSSWHFRLDGSKPVVSTANALTVFTREQIIRALEVLQNQAVIHDGLDYLQVFKDESNRRLCVTENEEAITALLPEDW